jgi:CSLREA domain-containing protein
MKRYRFISVPAIGLGLLLCAAGPPAAHGVACPGSGALVTVMVNNPTTGTISGVTLSGSIAGGSIANLTCTGASLTYTKAVSLAPGPNPIVVPTSGGLDTGYWTHKVTAPSGQIQYQKGAVMVNATPATVNFTYFPTAITVNRSDDISGSCPTNCTLRNAITAANAVSGTLPVLIQFSSSLANPTTVTMTQLTAMTLTRGNITIDGTYSTGEPWIVGDQTAAAAGNQDRFPRVIDLAGRTQFRVNSNANAFKGLSIKNTTAGGVQTQQLIIHDATTARFGTMITSVKIDAGNTVCSGGCTDGWDLVVDAKGDAIHTGVTLNNVEGLAAVDKGLELAGGAVGVVYNSWLHHNEQGNVGVAGVGSFAEADYSTIERAGLSPVDDYLLGNPAPGITLAGNTSTVITVQNVVRNNSSHGLVAQDNSNVQPGGDYFCGNGVSGPNTWNGLSTVSNTNGAPNVNGSGGIVTAYNQGHGVQVAFSQINDNDVHLNNDSAFVSNALCGLLNASPIQGTISARGNQWKEAAPPFSDICVAGSVDYTAYKSGANQAMSLNAIPTFPSNVIRKGQTIRVQGVGFNGIAGNPTASGCVTGTNGSGSGGQASSCCNKPTKANTCAASPPHTPTSGNCVELLGTSGTWKQPPVYSLTPTTIVSEIPDSTFGCVGTLGEQVAVTKLNSQGVPVLSVGQYCTNAAQL